MKGIIGKKVGMTRIIDESNGNTIPVTIIECGPNTITQVKTTEKDGYDAIVIGAFPLSNPTKNKKFAKLVEFRVEDPSAYTVGDVLDINELADKKVSMMGYSKGKGFAGVIKRHNFARGPETHGSRHHRQPGSIGACAMPGRVIKGKKMAGHMGNARVTRKNVPVVLVDGQENFLAIKGAAPGAKGTIIKLTID